MHPSVCFKSISITILLVLVCLQLPMCLNVQHFTDHAQEYEYSLNTVEKIYVAQPQEHETSINQQQQHLQQQLRQPHEQHLLHEQQQQQLPKKNHHPQSHHEDQQQFHQHQHPIHYNQQDQLEQQQQYQQQVEYHQHYHQSHLYQQQQQYLHKQQQVPAGRSHPSMQNVLQQKPFDYQVMNSELRIWKSALDGGEVEGLYINTYESFSMDPNGQYHLVHHQEQQQQHVDHIKHINTNIKVNVHQTVYNQNHLHHGLVPPITSAIESCSPLDPTTMYSPEQTLQQTCQASGIPEVSRTGQHGKSVPNLAPLLSDSRTSHNSNVEYPLVSSNQYPYESSLMSAIRHYWREVFALCLVSAVCLNWVLAVVKRRFNLARNEITEEITNHQASKTSWTASSLAQDSAFDEVSPSLSLGDLEVTGSSLGSQGVGESIELQSPHQQALNTSSTLRHRSSTLKAEPIPIPTGKSRTAHNQSSSSNPGSFSNSLNSNDYNSRYSSDFDSIRRLGRGGFGVVFEAKNKIDDCHYAIKRICLPLEKEGRERVMREVRALAKLDHAGIVRYYNAWLESPPDDWLKQHDAKFGVTHSNDGGMSFPSTDGIYENHQSKECSGIGFGDEDALGDSGDKLLDLFGQNIKFKQRVNGLKNKYLRNNSSSPSLDIVFEGSGSIRLESENYAEKLNGDVDHLEQAGDKDDIGDEEDNEDFIQFESRGRASRRRSLIEGSSDDDSDNEEDNDEDLQDISATSHLTEPFSSSSSSSSSGSSNSSSSSSNNNNVGCSKNSYGINGYMKTNIDTNIRKGDKEVEDKVRAAISKSISKQNRLDRKNILTYQKEARLLAESLHTEKAYLYIQMQLCHKETLRDWLKTNCEKRDSIEIMNLFYQIADAVEYVHSQDLIHRDLKPSNIFFSLDRTTVKIGDFGLCRAKTSTPGIGSSLDLQEYVSQPNRQFEAVHTEQVGTQLYMSPEQLNGLSYNQKVDIFAMGLILLELLIPFKTQMQRVNVLFKARNNLYSNEFVNAHQKEYELVKTLLNRSPHKRPTASEIKQHELLANAQLSQPVIERINQRRRTISSNSSTE